MARLRLAVLRRLRKESRAGNHHYSQEAAGHKRSAQCDHRVRFPARSARHEMNQSMRERGMHPNPDWIGNPLGSLDKTACRTLAIPAGAAAAQRVRENTTDALSQQAELTGFPSPAFEVCSAR